MLRAILQTAGRSNEQIEAKTSPPWAEEIMTLYRHALSQRSGRGVCSYELPATYG